MAKHKIQKGPENKKPPRELFQADEAATTYSPVRFSTGMERRTEMNKAHSD